MKRSLLILAYFVSTLAWSQDRYESLSAAGTDYRQVVVLSVNDSSISIRHSKGLSQVSLADLSQDLQQKYGYDSSKALRREKDLARIRRTQTIEQVQRLEAALLEQKNSSKVEEGAQAAFSKFGSVPLLHPEVDLRPQFRSYGIRVRSQSGPSCSVHAIVAALEFQFAAKHSKNLNLSEDYLVSATARSLGFAYNIGYDPETGVPKGWDAGFALEQVFQAIRGHGLSLEQSSEEKAAGKKPVVFLDVGFSPFLVPGGRSKKCIQNLIHVLNSGMPVVSGMAWPEYELISHTSVLSKQPPRSGNGHAVTIVGYRCEDGVLEHTKFIFRNSWGDSWGTGGYGFLTYEYLLNNLYSSYVVELQ
ncbi:C1 family peptidase [Pelagicoccus albus]|uniref:C1 family peptidase n=1 Tax=Pelagicoccus albus TaxID=415222 RepID=A0A7X1B2P5_9BACT|nr:C1 family peptidase [Pelagicoccus albus]MBC2604538.1 C1 family peptidase [Pelagicoccus albus]